MIDYASIGQRLRLARLEKGITQEQLGEAVGVGTTHISHLETGSGTISLKVLIAMLNYLGCSADEVLCKELVAAKPYVNSWLSDLVADCDQDEVKIIADTVAALKQTLRKNRPTE